HHVKVLLGVHSNSQPGNGEEEVNTLCGPSSGNATRGASPAFSCLTDPVQSAAIRPFGGPPPSGSDLTGSESPATATQSGVAALEPAEKVTLLDLMGLY